MIPVGEKAYRRIRSDIIFGMLLPRLKLNLDRLREDYGASVSTLRELLARLSSEAYMIKGQRGFEVSAVFAGQSEGDRGPSVSPSRPHALEQSFSRGRRGHRKAEVVSARHKLSLMEKRMLAGERADTELFGSVPIRDFTRPDLGVRIGCAAGAPHRSTTSICATRWSRASFAGSRRARASAASGLCARDEGSPRRATCSHPISMIASHIRSRTGCCRAGSSLQ